MQDRLFYSSNNYIEAKQVQDLLDQNNIVNYLKNEHIQNLFGDTRFLLGKDIIAGDIKIMVSELDFERACAVIEESGILAKLDAETDGDADGEVIPHDPVVETEAGHPTSVFTEETVSDGVVTDNRNSVKTALRGRSAEPNTNVFQMVLFSFFSFLIFPIFINIKNFVHFWDTRRTAVLMSIVLTVLILPFPIILIIENFYAAAPLIYTAALTGSIWLMAKGYKRFKIKHDLVSILMTLPFVFAVAFPFVFSLLANMR